MWPRERPPTLLQGERDIPEQKSLNVLSFIAFYDLINILEYLLVQPCGMRQKAR